MDLFDDGPAQPQTAPNTPLAARMRPRTLEEFVGQTRILGPDSLLRRAIEEDALTSVIFFGPPGVGKSTLSNVIAQRTQSHFENFSAVTQGIPDLRKVIEAAATRRRLYGKKTVLFIDEIHRFNKGQQDALLPHVENGTVVLIGATTENPYFEVNAPLLSRARVFTFESLSDEQLGELLDRAVSDPERGLGALNVVLEPEARAHLIDKANGDARTALNALELAATTTRPESRKADAVRRVTREIAEEALQRRALTYDKTGDTHYDTISAFIKSIRGSDPDAGLYYLAKMLTAGEDARFIARRLVILASEDVGNADPMGLVVANAAAHAVEFVGLPEAQLNLAQAVTYLASAPKSNASYVALKRALADVEAERARPVPKPMRDSRSGTGRKATGDVPYLYPHDYPGGYVAQAYLPEGVQTQPYYEPTENGVEAAIKQRMQERKADDRDDPRREQIAYYRARAGEYDEWFRREGRYDRGADWTERWTAEISQVSDALDAFQPCGDVLELAAGTGWWTERLTKYASTLTAVDAALETLAINRQKTVGFPITYLEADLFEWQPDRQYDVVFFSFWLSHVPTERFDAFWGLVRNCLAPGGRVFFLDSRYEEASTATDHHLEGEAVQTLMRRLNDGSKYRIVKVFYRPDELAARLRGLGWNVSVQETPTYFLYGFGTPAP